MTQPANAPREQTINQEALLLELARRLERHPQGRRAVQVHLSRLRPYNRREHHLRIARSTFENLVRAFDGQHFLLSNADLVFVCKGATVADVEPAVAKLRFLFAEDPIVQRPAAGEADQFCSWYDIEADYQSFKVAVESLELEERRRRAQTGTQPKKPEPMLAPLAVEQLGEVVHALARADMAGLIRRQPVCALLPGAPPHPVFEEVYVSIADLQRAIAPKTNLASSRWLFRYLTNALDVRMLTYLRELNDPKLLTKISVNLNVDTLVSQDFLEFDARISDMARGTRVIEMQLVDLIADIRAYYLARDVARDRGYKICVDGLTPATAPFVDREKLDVDLLKFIWSPDLADGDPGHRLDKTLVQRYGETRVILCRCDTDVAIRAGQAAGITLYQGRYVDALIAASKKPAPAQGAKAAS